SSCGEPVQNDFLGCDDLCGFCLSELESFPAYSILHPGCSANYTSCADGGTRYACPPDCPRPTMADRGYPTVFTAGQPFAPAPATTSLLENPNIGFPVGTRIINIGRTFSSCGTTDFGFIVSGSDAGRVLPSQYRVGRFANLNSGGALASLGFGTALDGSVTIAATSPNLEGSFDLDFGPDAGVVQGTFKALSCP
ncbi:MAG: hypothetical protein ABL982_26065, partial [Vicinamibacterales bacterium]